ncbi:hypothetical protein [Aliikangiella coralliicola]|uniref:Lipoprotein n=1 Tax=Aliikangiella coralliicola TaxID=2592383 RepID=A0A545UC50_9GAMM|nr:hypothetical protein [Aliikangiella coralliicola]TQV87040.1 hypothetical protein FLL46_14640 [Aliikangiella coralliicola]
MNWKIIFSTAGSLFIAACTVNPVAEQYLDWSKKCYDGFKSRVEFLAGEEFNNCGFYDLNASKRDYLNGVQCAENAYHSGHPFILGRLDYRADNYVCETHIRSNSGSLYKLFLDFDTREGPDKSKSNPTKHEAKCERLDFDGEIISARNCDFIQ